MSERINCPKCGTPTNRTACRSCGAFVDPGEDFPPGGLHASAEFRKTMDTNSPKSGRGFIPPENNATPSAEAVWDDFPPGGLHASSDFLKMYAQVQDASKKVHDAVMAANTARSEVSAAERKLGEAIRNVRIRYGKSLREVARHLKLSAPFLSDCERGNRAMSSENARKIIDFLCPKIK